MSATASVTETSNTIDRSSERIVLTMWRRQITQTALSDAIGLSQPSLSAKLRGHRRWYYDEIVAIAQVLETSVAWLSGEIDNDAPLNAENPAAVSATGSSSVAGERFELSTSRL